MRALNRLQAFFLYLAIIGAVTALGWNHSIGEQAVVAILGAIAGYVGGVHGTSLGVSQGSKATASPPPEPEA